MMAGFIIDGFGGYRYRGWRSLIAYDFGCGTEIPNTASPAFFNLSGKPTAGGQMIKDYKVLEEVSLRSLKMLVFLAIGKGWQPLGGVACTRTGVATVFMQTMVKYEEEA